MEVVAATPNGRGVSPFHNHDVREWSRMDSLTGVLERARRETDHWTANTSNSSHKYGKVVDCRARSGVDGNLQQEARRQLEVFQSQIPGGRLQVIKTHTVSSSKWTNKSSQELNTQAFEDLQLKVNPLDVSSQKSKASVGRSVGRRPPSRQQRIRNESSTTSKNEDTSVTNLHRVSRLCHQIHDNAVKQYFQRPSIHERQNGDGNVEISEIESNNDKNEQHAKLTRTKSTSSEDLHGTTPEQHSFFLNENEKATKSIEDLEDLEQLRSWRRTSKIRRSLQFPKQNKIATKPPDLPENNGSVRRIREDLEKGRRLNTALRGNNVDLEALDQILQSISTPYMDQRKYEEAERDTPEKEEEEEDDEESVKKPKRNSFVTVESIKEVRNRLRRTSSPVGNIYRDSKEEADDGIVTEDIKTPSSENTSPSKVRSCIYNMENSLSMKSVNGTGSLESRSKHLNGNSVHRNEDWYNRRKSYGFEKMYNHQEDTISKVKNTESSTDSGICRSSEIVILPNTRQDTLKSQEYHDNNTKIYHNASINFKECNSNGTDWSHFKKDNNIEGTTITIPIVSKTSPLFNTRKLFERELGDGTCYSIETWREGEDLKRHSIAVDESNYITKDPEPKFKRTSLAINTNDLYIDNEDDNFFHGRKPKKVEFCKTEVHFAAESGKVNIVETDEKPPPTNNFRRRRRNSGLIVDEFNSNGLPVFQFGDDIPNNENLDSNYNDTITNTHYGLVTVNSNAIHNNTHSDDDQKENFDNEVRKGILKNKLMRPRPYILGDDENYLSKDLNPNNINDKPWDIKLKPVNDETPIWRSTVTVRNTYFDDNNSTNINSTKINENINVDENFSEPETDLPEFQKLLKNLKPVTKRPECFCENYPNSLNGIRIISPNIDTRRSSWSVADRVKHVEDLQFVENKGYSTKINFGNGETTVVENNNKQISRHPTWPRREETSSDVRNQILNKGLVVRISRDDTSSKHTVCSKTTTNQNNSSTTTTKITIDLTPSPTNDKSKNAEPNFPSVRFPRASLHSFKSTSLILNTIKTENTTRNAQKIQTNLDNRPRIPEQLEALRKLYEDVHSDSETDKEVQTFMSKSCELDGDFDEECSSVVSGSWSKVSAFKNLSHYNRVVTKSTNHVKNDLHAQLEKDLDRMQNVVDAKSKRIIKTNLEKDIPAEVPNNYRNKNNEKPNNSPRVLRKAFVSKSTASNKAKLHNSNFNKLSSPALVGQNVSRNEVHCDKEIKSPNNVKTLSDNNDNKKGSLDRQSHKVTKHISPSRIRNKSPSKEVLRQPRKSEMAYFGVSVSPKPTRKDVKGNKLTEKPDLVKCTEGKNKTQLNYEAKEHIYENIDNIKKQKSSSLKVNREFDSSILEELTKAADQILQAVNGYTDEDSQNKISTDEEDKRKNNYLREPLDTISETKSWKQSKSNKVHSSPKSNNTKTKLKQTSSNSSVESVHKEIKKSSSIQKTSISTSNTEHRIRRKIASSDSASTKANTKARRLQRASSREALLQSHGSSSEDLPAVIEVPLRKPRLVKKTKSSQLTITNGIELKVKSTNTSKKREDYPKSKTDNRIPTMGLPEIRHKTAISTIRSTAEKAATREKCDKWKTSDSKKKAPHKRDSRGTGVVIKSDKARSPSSRESTNQRISTASNKKCSRYESSFK